MRKSFKSAFIYNAPLIDKKLTTQYKMPKNFINGDNYLWLLKPTCLNRGRGIHIFNNLEQLEKIINDYNSGTFNILQNTYITPIDRKKFIKKKGFNYIFICI